MDHYARHVLQGRDFRGVRSKRNINTAGDDVGIWGLVPCGNTSTCKPCCEWENFLHVERCWRGPWRLVESPWGLVRGPGPQDGGVESNTGYFVVSVPDVQAGG